MAHLICNSRIVHAAGGLCIIDEIQTGFGRAGDYFWLHESQGRKSVLVYKPSLEGKIAPGVYDMGESR